MSDKFWLVIHENFGAFSIVTIAYISAYAITSGLIEPLQSHFIPNVSQLIGLLFLPHGVRVFCFFFYGIRGFFYTLPAAYLTWYVALLQLEVPFHFLSPIISLISCYVGVLVTRKIFRKTSYSKSMSSWKIITVAGVIGSFLNGVGLSFLNEGTNISLSVLGYMLGDMAGLFICMVIVMYLFRFLRFYRSGFEKL